MNPKLIAAISERLKAGHTKEQIRSEVTAIGYDEISFETAFSEASTEAIGVGGEVVAPVAALATPVELLSFGQLVTNSWQLTITNLSLLGKVVGLFVLVILVISLTVGVIYPALFEVTTDYYLQVVVGLVTTIVFFVVGISSFGVLLRGLLRRNKGENFSTHLKWSLVNIMAISLVSIYVTILTQIGYLFFIIPGVALAIYLLFAVYFVADGAQRGIAALVASTTLVHGRMWLVFMRIILSSFVLLAGFIFIMVVASIVAFTSPWLLLVIVLLAVVLVTIIIFWQLCFMVVLFENLQAIPSNQPLPLTEKSLTVIYRGGIGLALLVFLALTLLATSLNSAF